MKAFLEKNKIPIAIVIAAVIIAAAVWLSGRQPANPDRTPPANEQQQSAEPTSMRISYTQAPQYIGKTVCVTGIVDHVYTSRKGTVFLNFCRDYKTCPFGAVIFASSASKFPNPNQYNGKEVEITGFITAYQGRTEIILDSPSQIKLAQ